MELGLADVFDRVGAPGAEEEFYIVGADDCPTSDIDDLVYGLEPPESLAGRLDHELFQFTIEIQTPLIEDPDETGATASTVREVLVDRTAVHGYHIAAAGPCPAAKWHELDYVTRPRYQAQLDRIQYPQYRNTTTGLHIHVDIDDADKAIWVVNEFRWYLAPLLTLSANPPFWSGSDTGFTSARVRVFESLPDTGMPTAFDDFEGFRRFERRMAGYGSIDDQGKLWYGMCPCTGRGTVEVHTPDAQTDPERVTDLVGYVHVFVLDLAGRYGVGESGTSAHRELFDKNKWRATRYGWDMDFIVPDSEGVVSLVSLAGTESDRLGVDDLRSLFDVEPEAAAQQRIHEGSGLDGLCEHPTLD